MTVWQFAAEHPFAAFCISCVAAYAFVSPFRLWFRSRNIRAQGWPPDHLDADGDIHRPCGCDDETEEKAA